MMYMKAGFVIYLVHRHLDYLFLLAPDEYPDGFRTPPLPSLISLAHPYLESSPRELKPLFLVALSLSFLTWTRRTSLPPEATSGSPPVFPTQLNSPHPHSIIRYVFLNYYARDGPRSPTG